MKDLEKEWHEENRKMIKELERIQMFCILGAFLYVLFILYLGVR